ncbi:uncharacterized protein [Amphiura filiformis]
MDCKKQNRKYGVCFPKTAVAIEQQICYMYTADCEKLMDVCNCTRACAALNRLATVPIQAPTTSPVTTQQKRITVKLTARQTAPPRTTSTQKPSKTSPSDETIVMTTWHGSVGGNGSDGAVTNTTQLKEGTTVASLSPELKDFDTGFRSMLSSVGILALVFGGLLLLCFVFIITVVCTCSCKRSARGHHTFKHDMHNKERHAYYYVDVDANVAITAESHKGKKNPDLANPIYNVSKENSLNNRFTNNAACDVYSEADTRGLVVIAKDPDEQFENLYAEVRPKSQAVSITPPSEAVAYFELEDNNQGTSNSMPYTELRSSAVYTDLQYGHALSSGSGTSSHESDSEIGSSTGHDDTDSGSRSGVSLSSADSGVDEHKENSAASSDFEGDNAHYFEATTLPLPHRKKSNGSLTSAEGCQTNSLTRIPEIVCDDSETQAPKIIEDNPMKTNSLTCYEKLHCDPKGRSFSIDSACSDNTYNALHSTSSLTLAEEDGKYSTLVREGKKRDTAESSDSDNMYSELCRDSTEN